MAASSHGRRSAEPALEHAAAQITEVCRHAQWPESVAAEAIMLLRAVHEGRLARDTAVARSRLAILLRGQLLRYWYFDGAPLSVRLALRFGVEQGLISLSRDDRARWPEYVAYWQELVARRMALNQAETIGGWLFPGESEVLWDLVRLSANTPGDVLELGSWLGRSATLLAAAIRHFCPDKRLHCADNWKWGHETDRYPFMTEGRDIRAEFDANLAPYCDFLVVHSGDLADLELVIAEAVAPGGVALLFHDAGHNPQDYERDLPLYVPLVAPQGFLVIHDYDTAEFPGTRVLVDELIERRADFTPWSRIGTMAVYRRNG